MEKPKRPESAERLLARRLELGLSQRDVGEAMGLGSAQESLSAYEKDGPKTIAAAERLAKILGVNPAWLVWGQGEKEAL